MSAAYGAGWQSGVFQCCSERDVCMDVFFCHWCANARQWNATDRQADNLNILICCVNFFCGMTYFTNCCVRCSVVNAYGLDESKCGTICMAGFCPACSMCQQHRELTARGVWPGSSCSCCSSGPPPYYVPVVPSVMGGGGGPRPGTYQQPLVSSGSYGAVSDGRQRPFSTPVQPVQGFVIEETETGGGRGAPPRYSQPPPGGYQNTA